MEIAKTKIPVQNELLFILPDVVKKKNPARIRVKTKENRLIFAQPSAENLLIRLCHQRIKKTFGSGVMASTTC